MRLVKPSIEFMWMTKDPLKTIEKAGRTCYKSENKITDISAKIFVENLIMQGHEAMIEHASVSYRIVCDRGVTHEIVRHRLFSYAQESTRYCNYKGGVTFIRPPWVNHKVGECVLEEHLELGRIIECSGDAWLWAMWEAEKTYKGMIANGLLPQQARSVLPNSLKTEIVITGNLREWRHFFKLRCSTKAHPQMQEVANLILDDIRARIPVVFDYMFDM